MTYNYEDLNSNNFLITIHFIGRKHENFILNSALIGSVLYKSALYYKYVNNFIETQVYNIFDKETIGEIEHRRLGLVEYDQLKHYGTAYFEYLPQNKLQQTKTNS